MRIKLSTALLVTLHALLLGSACVGDETLDTNRTPIANAGEDKQLDYEGDPVTVRLDARASLDHDGRIVTYRWLSADPVTDSGPMTPDPGDEQRPTLELEQGNYTFTLWVIDDGGSVSTPDKVTIRVGTDPVEECVTAVHGDGAVACNQCLCSIDDQCRTDVLACGDDCWALLTCIGQMCPDDPMDLNCILAACSAFIVGDAGTQAMTVAQCFGECPEECAVAPADNDGGT